jgi:hypothetical protein
MYNCLLLLPLTYLTSCTATRSKLFFANLFVTIFSECTWKRDSWQSIFQISYPFPLPRSFHRNCPSPSSCVALYNELIFYSEELLPLTQTPSWRPALFSCQQLHITYIYSYPPYLEAISPIHNLRAVTWRLLAVMKKPKRSLKGLAGQLTMICLVYQVVTVLRGMEI